LHQRPERRFVDLYVVRIIQVVLLSEAFDEDDVGDIG